MNYFSAFAANARTFIDLARLGRTDFWACIRALLRILLYILIEIFVLGVGLGLASRLHPGMLEAVQNITTGDAGLGLEFVGVAIVVVPVLWGLRDAVVWTHRRPFLSLVAADRRIEPRRILAGAAAWVIAAAICLPVQTLLTRLIDPSVADTVRQAVDWSAVASELPEALLLGLIFIPIQSATEEPLFRGWMTQILGQAVRNPVLLAILVAFAFALVHGSAAGPLALPYFMIASLGLSAISLADQRLELSIGAHTAQNLFVLLVAMPFLDPAHRASLLGGTHTQVGALALVVAVLQFALIYVLTRSTRFRRLFGFA